MDLAHSLQQIPDLGVATDVLMADHTSFGIGGPADVLVTPHTIDALALAVSAVWDCGCEPRIMGNGTNTLVLDGGIRGVVIKVANGLSRVTIEDDLIVAESGLRLASLCRTCADHGLGGLAWAAGIPGALGGALRMNAGANGGETGQFVQWVRVVRPSGEIAILDRADLSFAYRTSCFQGSNDVIAQAALRLQKADPAAVHQDMCETLETRCRKQPVAMRSAGCVFKRPQNDFAGRLLDQAGAKGMRVGGAVVSEKHANFIVNQGGATAQDVLDLIARVKAKVRDEFDVELVSEICIMGEPLPTGAQAPVTFAAETASSLAP